MDLLNSTTYGKLIEQDISVEVGDLTKSVFWPQFKTLHWGNDANFSARLAMTRTGSTFSYSNGLVEWVKGGYKARFYQLTKGGNRGFEFEVVLGKKPPVNYIEFTIESKSVSLLYQDVLTDAQKKTMTRPDDVVGSYAVYHSSKKNNRFKTGKAFHIYRPFAIDANGLKEWCEMTYNSGVLRITCPQAFLNVAAYPVIIDPTFGYTSIGGSDATILGEYATHCKFTTSAAATTTDIQYYGADAGSSSGVFRTAIYDGASAPTNLLEESPSTSAFTGTDAWFGSNITYAHGASETLWLAVKSNDPYRIWFDSGSTGQTQTSDGASWPAWEDPAVIGGGLFDVVTSIYANYTAGSGTKKLALLGVG